MEKFLATVSPYTISTYDFGLFRLDGGSMFGSVPKNLWAKKIAPDEQNRIELALRSLIIRGNGKTILVDTGIGSKWSEKEKQIYAISDLAPPPSDITDLILTHLHFDHAGGVSYRDSDGALKPTYPLATHYLQRVNIGHATNPTPKDKASYLVDNILPISSVKTVYTHGVQEILPSIIVHRIDGHTLGQQWIEIRSEDEIILFPSDLIPTMHHLPLAYHLGYDLCANTTLREKKDFIEYATRTNALIVFQHDATTRAVRIRLDGGQVEVVEKVE